MTKIVNGFRCSICDEEFQGFGNNASPFKGVCCDECNGMHVIPARMAMMFGDRPPYEVPSGGSINVTMGEPKPLED